MPHYSQGKKVIKIMGIYLLYHLFKQWIRFVYFQVNMGVMVCTDIDNQPSHDWILRPLSLVFLFVFLASILTAYSCLT